MNSDWTYALDMCAAHGVLDYDAAADILGQPPRFVGHPKMSELPPISPKYLPEDTKMKNSPLEDEFVKPNDDNLVQNPKWKKVLIGGIAIAGLGAGIATLVFGKGKFKFPKINLKNIKMPNFSNIKTSISNGAKTVWNFVKKPFTYLANLIKHKP